MPLNHVLPVAYRPEQRRSVRSAQVPRPVCAGAGPEEHPALRLGQAVGSDDRVQPAGEGGLPLLVSGTT